MSKIISGIKVSKALEHSLEHLGSSGSLRTPESLEQASVGRAPSPADDALMGLNHRQWVARSVFVKQSVRLDSLDTHALHDRIWKVEDVGGAQVSGFGGNCCGDDVAIIRIRHLQVGESYVMFFGRLYE